MEPYTTLALISLSLMRIATAICHGNNCARAVTGSGSHITPAIDSRIRYCSSFMHATVSPGPSTKTTTTTIYTDKPPTAADMRSTLADPLHNPLASRDPITVIPTSIPSYVATICTGASEYSSVCSCWGITPTVTTAAALTTTTTVTKYVSVGCETASYCPLDKVNTFRCGVKKRDRCACLRGTDRDDQKLCVVDTGCKFLKPCRTSDDCKEDEGCVTRHCCDGKKRSIATPNTKICLKYAPGGCQNLANARAVLGKLRVEEFTPRGVWGTESAIAMTLEDEVDD